MSIPIEEEDVAALKAWGIGLDRIKERCVLCGEHTSTWHRATNQPVCGACAEKHEVSQLPKKGAPRKSSARQDDLEELL